VRHDPRSNLVGLVVPQKIGRRPRPGEIDGLGRAERRAGSGRHGHDAVREQEGLLHAVGDHDGRHRSIGGRAQAGELLLERGPGQRVERAERLVQEQDFRFGGERPCDGDALPHAPGELGGPPRQRVAEADRVQVSLRLLALSARGPLRKCRADGQPDVLEGREPGQQ